MPALGATSSPLARGLKDLDDVRIDVRLPAKSAQFRLEMRLRLAEVLPVDLRPRIPEFTVGQLVSLRFAPDSELPALARKVLDEKMNDRKAIKQLIKNWQADHLRA